MQVEELDRKLEDETFIQKNQQKHGYDSIAEWAKACSLRMRIEQSYS
jgi:hypothetical protein